MNEALQPPSAEKPTAFAFNHFAGQAPEETADASAQCVVYDVHAEYERQDVLASQHWRITDVNAAYAVRMRMQNTTGIASSTALADVWSSANSASRAAGVCATCRHAQTHTARPAVRA